MVSISVLAQSFDLQGLLLQLMIALGYRACPLQSKVSISNSAVHVCISVARFNGVAKLACVFALQQFAKVDTERSQAVKVQIIA